MRTFWANRPYDHALDVREYGDLPELIKNKPAAGALWLFLAPRRGRKTWTLEAMKHRLDTSGSSAGAKPAHYVNLQHIESLEADEHLSSASAGTCLLLDEPLRWVEKEARAFLDRCVSLHKSGVRILLALTPRELSVLELIAEGRSNRQIGNRLGLTEGTVKGSVSILLDKLHVQDRTQAARLAETFLKKRV